MRLFFVVVTNFADSFVVLYIIEIGNKLDGSAGFAGGKT